MNRQNRDWSDLAFVARERRLASRQRELEARENTGTEIRIGKRRWINFGSNDYLGLAAKPLVPSTSIPRGGGASALVTGWTQDHEVLRREMAEFESTESAILFSSGFAACMGTVSTMAKSEDWILSDSLNHASLIDGCRLAPAPVTVYPHRDLDTLQRELQAHRHRYRRAWIVTDGVFSMDGTIAPLREICDLAEQYHADLIVDEAHATGVLGPTGRGACEALGVCEKVAIRIGTFSKAFGVQGGFVAADSLVIEHLINHCRSFIYSTAISPILVSAISDSLRHLRDDSDRRHRVQLLSKHVRDEIGMHLHSLESCVPIIAIQIGSDAAAIQASQKLSQCGLHVPAIRPPTVPDGTARLRVSLSAAHDDQQIDKLCSVLKSLRSDWTSN